MGNEGQSRGRDEACKGGWQGRLQGRVGSQTLWGGVPAGKVGGSPPGNKLNYSQLI